MRQPPWPSRPCALPTTFHRRSLLRGAGGALLGGILTVTHGGALRAAQADPLPSWNAGAAKQAILDTVAAATTEGSDTFVPPAERIATFDQDGTLWVEHPIYTQAVFAIERVKALAPSHPEWATTPPFAAILADDTAAMAKLSEKDWEQVIGVTHAGMTVPEFTATVAAWMATATDTHFGHPYRELVYQPMLEA
ncbi:MAG: hypothetical protein QM692_11255, partial [Thermomicrobiales bacterium]